MTVPKKTCYTPEQYVEMEDTDYKAAIADLFAQMELIDERIKQNQSETEQLRGETRVI